MNETTDATPGAPDLRLRSYLARWWHELVQFDGPTWRAFRMLVASPGKLTVQQLDHPAGARSVHPIRLYLTINVIFFLLAPWLNSAHISVWSVSPQGILQIQPSLETSLDRAVERSGTEDRELFLAVFAERLNAQQGALVWIFIPALGLASFLVGRRRRRYLVEHFVFGTNLVSFFLVSLLAIGAIARLLLLFVPVDSAWMIVLVVAVFAWMFWVAFTFYRSGRTFLELRRLAGVGFTFWLGIGFFLGVRIYGPALFLLALFGLRDLGLPAPG